MTTTTMKITSGIRNNFDEKNDAREVVFAEPEGLVSIPVNKLYGREQEIIKAFV